MFGHTELVIGGAIAGEFRVTRVEAPESIGPRLALSLECVLHDVHAEGLSEEPIEAYRLIGLIGELSLTRGQNPVAVLHWLGAGHWARSANYLQPVSLDLVLCSQSLFRFTDLGDDGLCGGGPDEGRGVVVSAIDVVIDHLD